MKKILFIAAAVAVPVISAQAQDAVLAAAGNNAPAAAPAATAVPATTVKTAASTVFITSDNQWQHIEMKTSGDQVYFTNLNGLRALKVHVTNADGREQMNLSINAATNAVNCKKLKPGLYFLTLVNEHTDEKKIFMLNRP